VSSRGCNQQIPNINEKILWTCKGGREGLCTTTFGGSAPKTYWGLLLARFLNSYHTSLIGNLGKTEQH